MSSVADLESASLSFSSLSGWAKLGLRDRFIELTDAVWRVRGYGDFLSYCLLAEGAVDIAAEPEVSVWDLAALDIPTASPYAVSYYSLPKHRELFREVRSEFGGLFEGSLSLCRELSARPRLFPAFL